MQRGREDQNPSSGDGLKGDCSIRELLDELSEKLKVNVGGLLRYEAFVRGGILAEDAERIILNEIHRAFKSLPYEVSAEIEESTFEKQLAQRLMGMSKGAVNVQVSVNPPVSLDFIKVGINIIK